MADDIISKLASTDGNHFLIVYRRSDGLYRFTEESIQLSPATEYEEAYSYFRPTHFSGLFESEQDAFAEARRTLPWLNSKNSN